jgi:hypothetical protein
MKHCSLSSAILLLVTMAVHADPLADGFGVDSDQPPPGKVVSRHVTMKPNGTVIQPAPEPVVVGSCATGPADCTNSCPTDCARGSCLARLKDWLCYHSSRPHECTLTPTGYQPPLYTYFPCKGLCGAWAPGPYCTNCAPMPVAAPPANTPSPPVPAPTADKKAPSSPYGGVSTSKQERRAAPARPTAPLLQGPLLPASAAAETIVSAPSTTSKPVEPLPIQRTSAKVEMPSFYTPSHWNEIRPDDSKAPTTNSAPIYVPQAPPSPYGR